MIPVAHISDSRSFCSCASIARQLLRIVSTTCAGARLRNFSSPSCRSELAITFSSCSISFCMRDALRFGLCGRHANDQIEFREAALDAFDAVRGLRNFELRAAEFLDSGELLRRPSRARGSRVTSTPSIVCLGSIFRSARSSRAAVTIVLQDLHFVLGLGDPTLPGCTADSARARSIRTVLTSVRPAAARALR